MIRYTFKMSIQILQHVEEIRLNMEIDWLTM